MAAASFDPFASIKAKLHQQAQGIGAEAQAAREALEELEKPASGRYDADQVFNISNDAYVNPAALFLEYGNELTQNDKGYKTTHRPIHESKSACVQIYTEDNHYWCYEPGCQKREYAVDYLSAAESISKKEARLRLSQQFGTADGQPAKPWIDVTEQDEKLLVPLINAALAQANQPQPHLFTRGSAPIRLEFHLDVPTFQPFNSNLLSWELWRAATFTRTSVKKNGNKLIRIELPPLSLIRTILGRNAWAELPTLRRVVRRPFLTKHGEMIEDPGYNEESQLFYAPRMGAKIPPITGQDGDVQEAKALYAELLQDFLFIDNSDKTNAMALALLPYVRNLIQGPTPLHCVEASQPRTGKSKLTQMLLYPALGRRLPFISQTDDEDEWRKAITTQLLSGTEAVCIDNVTRLRSGVVAGALTADVWDDRKLGGNTNVVLPMDLIWTMTGNNPLFSAEIRGRRVPIRITADREKPETRDDFLHDDLDGWVTENRDRFVWAGCTLAAAWAKAGMPRGKTKFGGFEGWAAIMSGLLEFHGYSDLMKNMADGDALTDPETESWRTFVAAWAEEKGIGLMTPKELVDIAFNIDGFDLGLKRDNMNSMSQKMQAGLHRRERSIFGQWRIIFAGKDHHTKKECWKLQSCSEYLTNTVQGHTSATFSDLSELAVLPSQSIGGADDSWEGEWWKDQPFTPTQQDEPLAGGELHHNSARSAPADDFGEFADTFLINSAGGAGGAGGVSSVLAHSREPLARQGEAIPCLDDDMASHSLDVPGLDIPSPRLAMPSHGNGIPRLGNAMASASTQESGGKPPAPPAPPAELITLAKTSPSTSMAKESAGMAAGGAGWSLITNDEELQKLQAALEGVSLIGFDCETARAEGEPLKDPKKTGLDPLLGRLRLVQIATEENVWIVDCFHVDPHKLAFLFEPQGPCLVGHNLKFDLSFFATFGLEPEGEHRCFDTMLASKLLHAGLPSPKGTHSLEGVVERWLAVKLDKTLQTSNWADELLQDEQLAYAALDAQILLPLHDRLVAELHDADLDRVAQVEMDLVPAMAKLDVVGINVDVDQWVQRAVETDTLYYEKRQQLEKLAPEVVKWSSNPQVLAYFRGKGHAIANVDKAALQSIAEGDAVAAALLEFRLAERQHNALGVEYARKYISHVDGRVHADYQQLGAEATGRMSCTNPNMQNLPRGERYRRCFVPDSGDVLVKCDYSQIELRIAAELSRDAAMIAAYRSGEDIHKVTASKMYDKPLAEVTDEDRQIAKSANFALLYGAGAPRFQAYCKINGIDLTLEQAMLIRAKWFDTYPGIRNWHYSQGNRVDNPFSDIDDVSLTTRTLLGRRRLDVSKYTEKLNTPDQGTGADILKLALARLWEDRARFPDAKVVALIHDEILISCPESQGEVVASWLKMHMELAGEELLTSVPVVVEAKILTNWAGV